LRLKDPANSVSWAGETKVGDRAAMCIWIVNKVPKEGKKQKWYFDKEHGLILKTETAELDRETVRSDYKLFNGVSFPLKLTTKVKGQVSGVWEVSQLEIVDKLDATVFEKPAKRKEVPADGKKDPVEKEPKPQIDEVTKGHGEEKRSGAADLSKLDRTIRKEPAYQSKPKYCLLVFGPKAQERVWLVLDDDVLYVDRNGNGDLTEVGERIKAPGFRADDHYLFSHERSIEVGDVNVGGLTHTGLVVIQRQYRRKAVLAKDDIPSTLEQQELQGHFDRIWRQVPDGVVYEVRIGLDPKCYGLFGDTKGQHVKHLALMDRNGALAFTDRPQDAPVVHFGGPLTLCLQNAGQSLLRGEETEEVNFWLGSPGFGPGTFAITYHNLIPKDKQPIVEILFPAKTGRETVTRKYLLEAC
jgi:hypothetical protein